MGPLRLTRGTDRYRYVSRAEYRFPAADAAEPAVAVARRAGSGRLGRVFRQILAAYLQRRPQVGIRRPRGAGGRAIDFYLLVAAYAEFPLRAGPRFIQILAARRDALAH